MLRRVSLLAVVALLLSLGVPGGVGRAAPHQRASDQYGLFLNILPSGQGKSVNAEEAALFEATGQYPAHFIDQLGMYDSLPTQVDQVTDDNLTSYFKQESFGVDLGSVERTETPKAGVTIQWDTFGVPHITGDTRDDAMFGVGYASAEDRLFMMDALRYVGRGRLSEFTGPTEANFAMDRATYLAAGYSEDELNAQVRRLLRYGAMGRQILQDGRQYIAGINQRVDEDVADPNELPAEYAALQIVPQHWVPADLVAVAIVIQAEFAGGGGNELLNGQFLTDARQTLGQGEGTALFKDLREREDPEAQTTADTPFPYERQGPVNPAAVAVPDSGTVTPYDPLTLTPQTSAPGSGSGRSGAAPTAARSSGGAPAAARLSPSIAFRDAMAGIGLAMPRTESNWLAVNADRTRAGHPIAVMGPQVGYFIPQILMDMDVHAPGLDASGATFPGVSLYVLLGRGSDFAWSATSGESDEIDVRAEKLCNPDGGDPSPDSTYYEFDGQCVAMYTRTDQWVSKPTPGGPGAPTLVQANVQRTIHGPVIARADVGGAPVAYVSQRSTFGAELDSSVSFYLLNSDAVHDVASFDRAMSYETGSFNWLYVDATNVAYYHSGLYPVRAPGVDTDLPSWGSGQWEWRGVVPASKHPQAVNPAKGWIDSWNNKAAPAWEASDANYNFGPVHRVQMLASRLAQRVPQGDMTPADMVRIMGDAATVDLRGQEVLPAVLEAIGSDPSLQQYLDILSSWVASGAHRIDRNGDGQYDDQAAVALMDTWWPTLIETVFSSTMGQGDLFDAFPMAFDDENRTAGLGSSFQDGYYGYVQKAVRMATGQPVAQPYRVLLCADGTADGCRSAVLASLQQAVDQLGPDPSTWDANEAGDDILYSAVGLITLDPQPWQNRPTFQQVVQVSGHR